VHGAFTKQIIEAMCNATNRPLIMPTSNPDSKMEAMPSEVIAWSKGRALVATDLPVDPVEYNGVTFKIGQTNNFLVYPGLALGVVVSQAYRITQHMLQAAAIAIAAEVDMSKPGAPLLPQIEDPRAFSAWVAQAVVRAAVIDRVANYHPTSFPEEIEDAMWQPVYPDAT
jgi:malate dehydrogenase (oxaloacetate-decarboxylating)